MYGIIVAEERDEMPKGMSPEQQTARFYRRRKIKQCLSVLCGIILRLLGIDVTAVCVYWVFFDAEAWKIRGIAAAALFVLLYAQCASFSMLGLRMFSKSTLSGTWRLGWTAILICAPLYFVVFVVSLIPLTQRAAFFLTVFPALILNALPMESICDEYALRGFPTPLFWGIQIGMQMLVFAAGQMYGLYLLQIWG